MFGRSTRSILPTGDLSKAFSSESVLQEKLKKKLFSQDNYNQSAKDLKPLVIGKPVLLRDFGAAKDKYNKWMTGKVLERLSGRSYAVLNDETGNVIRRNRIDIRCNPSGSVDQSPTELIPELDTQPSPETHATADAEGAVLHDPTDTRVNTPIRRRQSASHDPVPDVTARRSTTRERRLPIRYQDYEMK